MSSRDRVSWKLQEALATRSFLEQEYHFVGTDMTKDLKFEATRVLEAPGHTGSKDATGSWHCY